MPGRSQPWGGSCLAVAAAIQPEPGFDSPPQVSRPSPRTASIRVAQASGASRGSAACGRRRLDAVRGRDRACWSFWRRVSSLDGGEGLPALCGAGMRRRAYSSPVQVPDGMHSCSIQRPTPITNSACQAVRPTRDRVPNPCKHAGQLKWQAMMQKSCLRSSPSVRVVRSKTWPRAAECACRARRCTRRSTCPAPRYFCPAGCCS